MTSLGPHATTTRLDVVTLGSENSPVETIYRASTDFFQKDLTYIETDSDEARFRIKEDGHLQIVEGLELFHGTEDLRTATKQFSLGLTSTGQFVIRDEVNSVDRLTIGDAGLVLSVGDITGVQDALNTKQNKLTSGGLSVSSELLTTLPLVAGSDANNHSKIPSALAVENAIESATADCITGTNGGVRTGTVTTSATNVPSCLAVSNFVSNQVPLIGDSRYLQLANVETPNTNARVDIPGFSMYLSPVESGGVFYANVTLHTGPPSMNVVGWVFKVLYNNNYASLLQVTIGDEDAPWNATPNFFHASFGDSETVPQYRTHNGTSYNSFAPITDSGDDPINGFPNIAITSISNPASSWNIGQSDVFVMRLTMGLKPGWSGVEQVIFGAFSKDLINQGVQNMDSLVPHLVEDDGFSRFFSAPGGGYTPHNRIPMYDEFYRGVPKFDGLMRYGFSFGNIRAIDDKIEVPKVEVNDLSCSTALLRNSAVLNEPENDAKYQPKSLTPQFDSVKIGNHMKIVGAYDYLSSGLELFGLHVVADNEIVQQYPLYCDDIRYGNTQRSILSLEGDVVALQNSQSTLLSVAHIDVGIVNELSVGTTLATSGVTLGTSGLISTGETLAVSGDVVHAAISDVESSLDGKHPLTTVDSTPTASSTNLITSGGVYDTRALHQWNTNGMRSYNAKTTTGSESVALGKDSGAQGFQSIAIGTGAGAFDQGPSGIAIGALAANISSGSNCICIGGLAGYYHMGNTGIAIGGLAASISAGSQVIAIGREAGSNVMSDRAIALGAFAGRQFQGEDSLCLGNYAGYYTCHDRSIILNATGLPFDSNHSDSFYVSSLRNDEGVGLMQYDTGSGEVTYSNTMTYNVNFSSLSVGEFYGAISASDIGGGTVSNTEFSHLNGVTSSIQTQLNDKHPLTTVDTTPTASSTNLVTSGGVHEHVGIFNTGNSGIQSYNASGCGARAIAIGGGCGVGQEVVGVAVGENCGGINQRIYCVALGNESGRYNQGYAATAIGRRSGLSVQGAFSVAIGHDAAKFNQGGSSIAIGRDTAIYDQGANSIAIGTTAGLSVCHDRCVVLNGSGVQLDTEQSDSLYVAPIRDVVGTTLMHYNINTNEVTHSNNIPDEVTMSTLSVSTLVLSGGAVIDSDVSQTTLNLSSGNLTIPRLQDGVSIVSSQALSAGDVYRHTPFRLTGTSSFTSYIDHEMQTVGPTATAVNHVWVQPHTDNEYIYHIGAYDFLGLYNKSNQRFKQVQIATTGSVNILGQLNVRTSDYVDGGIVQAGEYQALETQTINNTNDRCPRAMDVHNWHNTVHGPKVIYQAKLSSWTAPAGLGPHVFGSDMGTFTEDINITSETILVSGYKFTVPRSGCYRVAGVFDQGSDADCNIGLLVNDVQKYYSRPPYGPGEQCGYLNALVSLSANDYITFTFYDGQNSYSINTGISIINITEF